MSEVALEDFIVEFGEFSEYPTDLVRARLGQAHRMLSEEIFGELYLDAVKYQAAELLCSTPFASSLRLEKGSGESIYTEALAKLKASVPATGVVVNLCGP